MEEEALPVTGGGECVFHQRMLRGVGGWRGDGRERGSASSLLGAFLGMAS